jgi:hypothetical protein
LALFSGTPFGMEFNKGCATGKIAINADTIREIASGRLFQPTENDPSTQKTGTVTALDPADYPTDMVQRAFEFMRRHKNFRAAWVFRETETSRPGYVIGVVMEPHDAALYHDFNLTVHLMHSLDYDTYLMLLDEKSRAAHREMMEQTTPFYTAPDYQQPPGACV